MEHIGILGLDSGFILVQQARARDMRARGFDRDAVKIAQIPDESDRSAWSSDDTTLTDVHTYVISVPTRIIDETLDLEQVKDACALVGSLLSPGALVIIESPLEPGMCEQTCLPILEKESGLSRYEFHFAYCPLREPSQDGRWHTLNTPRVIGAQTDEALERAGTLYRSLLDAEIFSLASIKEAETVHLLESAFENVNAALANELAMAIRDNHLDITCIVRGAATKPFGFLATLPGFVPARMSTDPLRTLHRGMRTSSEHRLFAAAHKVNHGMPGFVAHLLTDALREKRVNMKKAVVALLGLDAPLAGGPIATLADALKKKGVSVRAYDPRMPLESAMRSLETTLPGVKAVIIARADPEFCALTPDIFTKHDIPIAVDACNCLDKAAFLTAGILYRGIGR